jgi:putative toxin-antitoxin system antitoxin component (TIGR02293 family)
MPRQGSVVQIVYRKLGGRAVLGQPAASEADLARIIVKRIPLRALTHLRQHGFSDSEIQTFVIPSRTRRHREKRAEPLNVDESDRVIRLARIQTLAEQVFEDEKKANAWLRQPLNILDGKAPLDLVRTDAGARVVEQILAKIDWGAAA